MQFRRGSEKNLATIPDCIEHRVVKSNDRAKVRRSIWKALHDLFTCYPGQGQFTKEDLDRMKDGRAPYCPESQRLPGQDRYHIHHKKPRRTFTSKMKANLIENLVIMSPKYHRDGNHIDDIEHYGEYRAKKVQEDRNKGR